MLTDHPDDQEIGAAGRLDQRLGGIATEQRGRDGDVPLLLVGDGQRAAEDARRVSPRVCGVDVRGNVHDPQHEAAQSGLGRRPRDGAERGRGTIGADDDLGAAAGPSALVHGDLQRRLACPPWIVCVRPRTRQGRLPRRRGPDDLSEPVSGDAAPPTPAVARGTWAGRLVTEDPVPRGLAARWSEPPLHDRVPPDPQAADATADAERPVQCRTSRTRTAREPA